MSARHRAPELLLHHGIVYAGGKAWTRVHDTWQCAQRFDSPVLQLAFDASFEMMLAAVDRRDRLDTAIAAMAATSPFTPVVTRLGCLRGVSTLTSFALAVEIGDRCDRRTGRSIGAYPGLVTTESSSGTSRSQEGITKTRNANARRMLIEAAWHHRPGTAAAVPPCSCTSSGQGSTPRQRPVVANTAIARELAGWYWSLVTLEG